MRLVFDHLAVVAADLEVGTDWARERLGVDMNVGGAHPKMGTHNRLTRTGPDNFLEIIAIDPEQADPGRKRWYRMDDPAVHEMTKTALRPLSWIVATDDLDAVLGVARDLGLDLGEPVQVSRGDLTWRLSVRDDGDLPEGGTLPVFIQWPDGPHPAGRMPDLGLSISKLILRHPEPDRLGRLLSALGVRDMVELEDGQAGIAAEISRLDGPPVLID
ncbi:VOC family protein [Nisaea nitritireducens]|uniref:VOC family protein n=1 Tax=Nisaea nitritireducens TaxID=568392 RepID=UPI0018675DA7|nr:VOC family protein [Nisaea nitritireducens]